MALPVGSRFRPTDVGLVRSYLRNKMERKESSFITTMDLYKDEEPMTEYTLPKSRESQALVLCHIRLKKSTEDKKLGFVKHVLQPQPQPKVAETNNVISNQLVQEESDFADELEEMMLHAEDGEDTQQQLDQEEADFADALEALMLKAEDDDDTQQQLQHQEEEIQILPLYSTLFDEE